MHLNRGRAIQIPKAHETSIKQNKNNIILRNIFTFIENNKLIVIAELKYVVKKSNIYSIYASELLSNMSLNNKAQQNNKIKICIK